jgi:signal transduction histidine kinase
MPRILHIEDDPANRLLVRKILTPQGYEVIEAEDGIEGIRKARTEKPDLVLLDIAIPGLDGYEVTLRLRSEANLDDVPIVAITAEGSRETSLAVGCNGFLQKPIDARTFCDTLAGYLKGRREQSSDTGVEHLRAQSQRIVGHLEEKLDQLSQANARLVELDRARKEFYRNVSHELATPMTPIVGYIRLLSDEELGPVTPGQRKAIGAIDECAARLRGLIDNLLDVTAIETGRMRFIHKDYDFRQVAIGAVTRARALMKARKLRLVDVIPDAPMPGIGDPDRLGRAIDQLLENAAKFTPADGAVGVLVRVPSEGRFEVRVADTGPGLPKGSEDRVFEPFYQVDGSETRPHGGAGVGLAVVRGVAQGHGGYVRSASPGKEEIGGLRFNGAAFSLVIGQNARMLAP